MKIQVAYVAVTNGPLTAELAARFVGSWLANPPGVECQLTVCCNGGPLSAEIAMLFSTLDAQFFPRVNDGGKDISAYQDLASKTDADMLVCFGESVYFHRPGWLQVLASGFHKFGPGMYGCFSSGCIRHHMNTSGFAVCPKLLRTYPLAKCDQQRYEFEHGTTAFWRRLNAMGRPTKFVTWDGIWEPRQWRVPQNILSRGDQSNLLVWCNHVDRFRSASPEHKRLLASKSDEPYR